MAEREGRLTGYIMGLAAGDLIAVGPWVVDSGSFPPLTLLQSMALSAGGALMRIGILEFNPKAAALLRTLGSFREQDHSWRMAMGAREDLGTSEACFAIGSPAKG